MGSWDSRAGIRRILLRGKKRPDSEDDRMIRKCQKYRKCSF